MNNIGETIFTICVMSIGIALTITILIGLTFAAISIIKGMEG
jgi:ABC-type nickel/cobalt efflux system permease component RcnA